MSETNKQINIENVRSNQEFLTKMYDECMNEVRDFRNSTTKFFVNFSTVIILILGWCETNTSNVTIKTKIIFSLGLLFMTVFFIILTLSFRKYFDNSARVVNRLDKIFKCYEENYYIHGETLLPKAWENFGDKDFKEPIFEIAKWGFLSLVALGFVVIWTL